jgi:hypothetical protein
MNEGRDRRNKRSRKSKGSQAKAAPAAPAGVTANPENLKTRLGPRLEKAVAPLELQPKELQDLLTPKLKAMLSIFDSINQRKETLAKADKPMIDTETNKPIKQLNDPKKDLPFIPSALRNPMPFKPSNPYKDDPDMKACLLAAQKEWENTKMKMAEHDVLIKKLEIKLRWKSLQTTVIDFVELWASGLVITKLFKNGGTIDGGLLTKEELKKKATFDIMIHESYEHRFIEELKFSSSNNFVTTIKQHLSYNDAATDSKATANDEAFLQPIVEELANLVGPMTLGIWKDEDDKDEQRLINAAIRSELRPQAITQATANVRAALDAVNDSDDPHKKIMDDVRKTARTETTRQLQSLMKSQRKKSLGDIETHVSTPRKSGQNGNNKSKKRTPTPSNKRSKEQPKSVLKKGKQVKFSTSPAKESNRGRTQGNRGGSRRGGRGRGGGRR